MFSTRQIAVLLLSLSPNFAWAECKIWTYEDTSAVGQNRARVFVSADLKTRDEYVAR